MRCKRLRALRAPDVPIVVRLICRYGSRLICRWDSQRYPQALWTILERNFGYDMQLFGAVVVTDEQSIAGQPAEGGDAAKIEREIRKSRERSALGMQVSELE